MVKISEEIKKFFEEQGIFVVGTIGVNNLPNVSPRIFFKIDEDGIYWIDFFKHKSYKNIQVNPWVTVAVFNKDDLKGYQFRGIAKYITIEPTRTKIKEEIINKIVAKMISKKIKNLSEKIEFEVIRFEPKVCYSLNPEEYSDMLIGSDIDSKQLFQK